MAEARCACKRLLFRITPLGPGKSGESFVEIKCPRCKKVQRLDLAAMEVPSGA